MKKTLLSIITSLSLSLALFAQDSTALAFSETNINYAVIPTPEGSNLRFTGDWTVEAWVKVINTSTEVYLIETYFQGGLTSGFILKLKDNRIQAYQRDSPFNYDFVLGNTDLPLNEWSHIAATLNETTKELKVYLNGVLENTKTTTISTNNNNTYIYIGSKGDILSVKGKTEIDDIRIWNVAKTQEEIQALSTACLTGNETGLLAMYNFEKNDGYNFFDKTPNENDGWFQEEDSMSTRISNCVEVINSINVQNAFENLNIYPNPTSNIINIENTEKLLSIKIMDLTGKTIKEFNADARQLDISEFTPGIYFLEIANAEKKSVIKIIKK